MAELDIVIPVYNEGANIIPTLESLRDHVKTSFRVLICYDFDEDTTLSAIKESGPKELEIMLVKNQGKGAQGAVLSGFAASDASSVIMIPADDDYNATILDAMVEKARDGAELVCASRFIKGGCMKGCRFLKASLVRIAAFSLYHFGRLPTRDATNGFRLFSRRLLNSIEIESTTGFCYSIELLVKCHRLRWKVSEVPAQWFERKKGGSRFQVLKWLPAYLKWFFYAFATTYLFQGPSTVKLKPVAASAT